MRDLVKEIQSSFDVWEKHAKKRIPEDEVTKVKEYVEERLTNLNPVLSLYGAYNAGKSTLLNALVGKEIASTGDSPETTSINEYHWGKWTFYDTPGIDAPIEHEKTTDEHLRKSECILFVISTDGDLEARLIYEKLAELTQRKKPVLLVLNDKIGVLREENADKETEIYNRININIDKIWSEKNLTKYPKPEKIIVNAKSALKARLSEASGTPKHTLLEKSYLPMLEEKLENFLRKRGTKDIVNSLIDFLIPEFNNLIEIIENSLKDQSAKTIEHSRKELETNKKKILLEAERYVRKELSNMCYDLRNIDINERTKLQQFIDERLISLSDTLNEMLSEKISKVAEQFQTEFIGYFVNLSGKNVLKGISLDSNDNVSNIFDEIISKLPKDQLKDKMVTITKKNVEKLGKKIGEKIGKILSEKIGKAIGDFLKNNAAKIAGGLVTAVFAIIEINQALKDQAEYENQIRKREEAYEQIIARLQEDTRHEIMKGVKEIVEDFFKDCLNVVDKMEKTLKLEQSSLNKELKELRTAYLQLQELQMS